MSRCCCKKQVEYRPVPVPAKGNNCICSLPTLIILILIVLQFSKPFGNKCCTDDDDYEEGHERNNPVGNGILFIIALFFLSCSGCGRGSYGSYGA